MFNLSPIYYAHKSSNHTFSENHRISPDIYMKQNIHKHPTAPVKKKKPRKARTRWYRGPFRRFINTRFKKKKKKWTEAIQNLRYYINA